MKIKNMIKIILLDFINNHMNVKKVLHDISDFVNIFKLLKNLLCDKEKLIFHWKILIFKEK